MARKPQRLGVPEEEVPKVEEVLNLAPEIEIKDEIKTLYKVKVTHPSLRRRSAPSIQADIIDVITDEGVYNVTEESDGWAHLSDGGWIMLQFCQKIEK